MQRQDAAAATFTLSHDAARFRSSLKDSQQRLELEPSPGRMRMPGRARKRGAESGDLGERADDSVTHTPIHHSNFIKAKKVSAEKECKD